MENNLNILVFDVETFPLIVKVWRLGDQRVNVDQIVQDSSVCAWAAKWLGAPASQTMYRDTRGNKDVRDDRHILELLWKLLDEADIVITQNGQHFDSRVLNARFIQYGMKPPKPYKHLDTYKIAKAAAEFTSHKLEYLTDKLCTKYKKLSHKKFPGRSLWNECERGNIKAWDEMKRYNINDVLSTEELYTKLQAWTPKTAPVVSLTGCPSCGSKSLERRGVDRTLATQWQRLHCKNCGKWSRGERIK